MITDGFPDGFPDRNSAHQHTGESMYLKITTTAPVDQFAPILALEDMQRVSPREAEEAVAYAALWGNTVTLIVCDPYGAELAELVFAGGVLEPCDRLIELLDGPNGLAGFLRWAVGRSTITFDKPHETNLCGYTFNSSGLGLFFDLLSLEKLTPERLASKPLVMVEAV